jgi:biopolymer transport protein ExbD
MKPRSRRRRPRIVVPVASMGDIAFLLIIFFMICSNFAKEAGIHVEPPRSRDIDRIKESTLVVAMDAEGVLYFQGRRVDSAKTLEADLTDQLEGVATEEGRTVLFRCDRSLDKALFEPVMDAIAAAGGRIAAVGEKGAPKPKPR